MAHPPWPFDTITDDLINAYVKILSTLTGWGVNSDGSKAVYPGLALPMPQEPFPAAYVYLEGQTSDQKQGTGYRLDVSTVAVRIIGGPATPRYKFDPEHKVYQMLTPTKNILSYRRYLEDPTNNNQPFKYIVPEFKLTVGSVNRIRVFSYEEQGKFVGIEVPTTIGLMLNVGRLS